MSAGILDWTEGSAGLAYQRCDGCGGLWYMRRDFCPDCGRPDPVPMQASGQGTVYAVTEVLRAPTEALRPYVPYTIVLVQCAEGFRVMAHGSAGLRIGDAVTAEFVTFGGGLLPRFLPS